MAVALPEELQPANSIRESDSQRERLLLSFQYHSTKLLICRPCLCRLEQHIKNQTDGTAELNRKTAEACVQGAQAVARIFPDQPNYTFIYQQSPWWCIVHYIMQSIAVFLLEMLFSEMHITDPGARILENIKKLLRWLQFLSVSNAVAKRAYEVVIGIINTSAPRLRVDISDILAEGNSDQNYSFQAYWPPGNTAFPSYPENSFPQAEWRTQSLNYPTVAADFSTQYSTSLGEQQPARPFEGFQSDQSFPLELDLQIPAIFGNPFFTNFDLLNPLADRFSLNRDAFMDDV